MQHAAKQHKRAFFPFPPFAARRFISLSLVGRWCITSFGRGEEAVVSEGGERRNALEDAGLRGCLAPLQHGEAGYQTPAHIHL